MVDMLEGVDLSQLPYQVPNDDMFGDEGFFHDEDLEAKAHEVIERHRGLIGWLDARKLAVLWKKTGGAKNGNATLGKCQKPSGLLKFFSDREWVIWLAADHCRERKLTERQVEALLFHELLHPVLADGQPAIRGHDVEAFNDEIREYGLWMSNLVAAGRAFQMRMAMDGES